MKSAYSQLLDIMRQTATPDGDTFVIGDVESSDAIIAGGNKLDYGEDFLMLDQVDKLENGDKVLMAYIDTAEEGNDYYVVLGKLRGDD